ncbi:uncharacterized protein MYCFIDRAFT_210847 [Pseudocercospora fijiensis CIRAD86]|uniref:Uncharacterized protein n=1 Tax=Pseudocercospora fijiensis (strain CIRAD86) TaxID=383855 RepID=M3B4L2_PSEFD|nr:uncharacterized protein MYCFIDRAFT_210847 [Pseudocercospora fijiensis CIRAD86]EME84313.1 hypothetical protein MYCFIDRAFT_210847 [Pseudocercospora fijiensis CIRAD86]
MASGTNTPRSRSRAKRSTTNLADLRLAPLSKQYEPTKGDVPPKSPLRTPYDAGEDASFARQHLSYLHGKSAPTTPGILSRSNSRRHLGGGLSRKNSIYDNNDAEYDAEGETGYTYSASANMHAFNQNRGRTEYGSGQIPKAKSEAAITAQQRAEMAAQRLAGPGVPVSKRYRYSSSRGRKSGNATPRPTESDNWLTHTGSTASMLVREDKGQSWLSSRESATALAPASSEDDDDDDDHYEEMAALSSTTNRLRLAQYDGGSPVSQRTSRWGSRYGSRPASRKTSRLASPVGSRTPRRSEQAGYFDYPITPLITEPGFVSPEEKRGQDEEPEEDLDIEKLSGENSYGLGNLVDRIMHFNLFSVTEHIDTTDDENAYAAVENETPEESRRRMEAEAKRKKEEKDRLTAHAPPAPLGDGGKVQGEVSGWQDASWLLSVASKVIMN